VSAVTGRRRVVMTLDSAEFDSGDLARLTHLAQQLDAEFEAVFVEDLDVLRAANLPFLREYRFASMQLEAITQQRLEQEFRAVARRAEQALAQQAALRQVRWRFRVWRGSLEQELLGALEADVLALPPPAMAIRNAAIPPRDAPIAVCFSGDEGDQRTLVTASALAAAKTPLTVVLVTDGRDVDELRQQAEAVAAGGVAGNSLRDVAGGDTGRRGRDASRYRERYAGADAGESVTAAGFAAGTDESVG
jgi:hypothetical protein